MQTNTEMRAIDLPVVPKASTRSPTVPLTARAMARSLPRPSAAHQRMIAFIGQWRIEGGGGCTGEWLPGERALILRWSQRPGDPGARDMWVMTPDARPHTYALHRFDAAGRAVGYQAVVDGDTWTITGTDQRATVVFATGGAQMTQTWETRQGAVWVPAQTVTARRA